MSTVPELKQLCKARGIFGVSRLRKAELIDLLKLNPPKKSSSTKKSISTLASREMLKDKAQTNKYKITLNLKYHHINIENQGWDANDISELRKFQDNLDKKGVVAHVKKHPAKTFVEWVADYMYNTIISAEWIPNKFAVQFTVKSSQTINELKKWIGGHENLLHIGDSDSGWIVATPRQRQVGTTNIASFTVVKVK